MLFRTHEHAGLRDGSITVAFRRWRRPSVRTGGSLRTPAGVLAIEAVERITPAEVTDADARRAGHADRAAVLAATAGDHDRGGELYRVRLRYLGTDPREALAGTLPDAGAVAAVLDELADIDRRSRSGPWTHRVLALVAHHPDTRAADLAEQLDQDVARCKRAVRRLKDLGLTESRSVGYRLSPRGTAVLAALDEAAGRDPATVSPSGS